MSYTEKLCVCVYKYLKLLKVQFELGLFSLQADDGVMCQNIEVLCSKKLPIIFHSQICFLVGSEINNFNHKTSTSKKQFC